MCSGLRIGNDAVQEFGAAEDAGNTGTGVSARADEVEILDVFADVVGAEPGALGEDGLELEGGAEVRVEVGLEIERRVDHLADDVFP